MASPTPPQPEGRPVPERLCSLRSELARRGGLTAREWDEFDALERRYDPTAFTVRREQARRNLRLRHARELSLDDLLLVVAEKQAESA